MKIKHYLIRGSRIIRLLFVKIGYGKNIKFISKINKYNISNDTSLSIEKDGKMILSAFSTKPNVHLCARGGILQIGEKCSFNRNDIIVSAYEIRIGDRTEVGPNVCIYDHDHAFNEYGKISEKYKYSSVNIGENVWIGAGVIILRGSTIGNNCIIGAGCVISGEIPDNMIVTSSNRKIEMEPLHT